MFETDDNRSVDFVAPSLVQKADVVIVEACTLKTTWIDKWEVNAHRFWHAQKNQDPRANHAITQFSTSKDLAEAICQISGISGKPVIAVNHIARTGDIAMDQSRESVTDALKEAMGFTPFFCFDTSIALNGFDTEIALVDHNHYRPTFEKTVGQELLAFAKAAIK
ncbi:hypothetical protein [Paracoccus xiamenensis]|uniref:hypothetical protein n=1 Tax=Paracoccus xiamenensis TaxID=2714901 RepID=UPI00140BB53D|nr:hypothetical protein [Paracoccus xiamenensis]NHF72706.1 hypothetical protein [Paracoccus xiamenensis]